MCKLSLRNQREDQRGFILLSTVLIFSFVGVLGLSLVDYLTVRQSSIALEIDRLKALYLAEAALSHAIYEIKNDFDEDGNGLGNIEPTALGGGTYSSIHDPHVLVITGVGEYNQVKRRLQIKYSPL
jgi:Tfp pilus assembly protein PilX